MFSLATYRKYMISMPSKCHFHLKTLQHVLRNFSKKTVFIYFSVFLKDLENCRSTPSLVGKCFVRRVSKITYGQKSKLEQMIFKNIYTMSFFKLFVAFQSEEFQMYSTYCQNKLQSEALRREVGDNNPFFQECQQRLNHRLPLGAYLLKPVQRVTKYQLLLKVSLKYWQFRLSN